MKITKKNIVGIGAVAGAIIGLDIIKKRSFCRGFGYAVGVTLSDAGVEWTNEFRDTITNKGKGENLITKWERNIMLKSVKEGMKMEQ